MLSLNIMQASEFNSFLEPDHTGTSFCGDRNSIKETIEVPVRRLDDVVTDFREAIKLL